MADDGYLPEDLPTEQATYDADLYFVVKKTGISQARKMLLGTAIPKPYTLDAIAAGFNRDSVVMAIDDGSGNLYKITPNEIYEAMASLSAAGTISSSDSIRFYDLSETEEKKIGIDTFAETIFAFSSFGTLVDARFGNTAFNSDVDARFIDENDNFTDAVDDEIDAYVNEAFVTAIVNDAANLVEAQAMVNGGVTYGYLSMQKVGKIVVGQVVGSNAVSTGGKLADYTIPAAHRPSRCGAGNAVGFQFRNDEGVDVNALDITEAGGITMDFRDIAAGTNGVAFNWLTD